MTLQPCCTHIQRVTGSDMHTEKRMDYIQIRVNKKEKNKIKGLTKLYAAGDVSLWMRWAGINAERKFLKKRPRAVKPEAQKR